MAFNDVKLLRQAGRLDEALSLALSDLEHDAENIWNKRSAAWVYAAIAKEQASTNSSQKVIETLRQVQQLELPESETMLFDNLAWQIGKTMNHLGDNDQELFSDLMEICEDFHFSVQAESYSFLVKCMAKKCEKFAFWPSTLEWWKIACFQSKDFENSATENGIKLLSAVEQIYIALAKLALATNSNDHVVQLLPTIRFLCHEYPKMAYVHYYHAKLLLAAGNKDLFLQAFIPFARKKQRDFWVWELIAEVYSIDSREYFACLCKSLACGAPFQFSLNVKEKLAACLIAKEMFSQAKREIEDAIQIRMKNDWRLTLRLEQWTQCAWYANTSASTNNNGLYEQYLLEAGQLLHADKPEVLIVVDNMNIEKKIVNFLCEDLTSGFFCYANLNVMPKSGDRYRVRFEEQADEIKSNYRKVITMSPTQEISALLRETSGTISIRHGNSFGFVNDAYVHSDIVQGHGLTDGQLIHTKVIKSFNKKTKTWGWKVISVK